MWLASYNPCPNYSGCPGALVSSLTCAAWWAGVPFVKQPLLPVTAELGNSTQFCSWVIYSQLKPKKLFSILGVLILYQKMPALHTSKQTSWNVIQDDNEWSCLPLKTQELYSVWVFLHAQMTAVARSTFLKFWLVCQNSLTSVIHTLVTLITGMCFNWACLW